MFHANGKYSNYENNYGLGCQSNNQLDNEVVEYCECMTIMSIEQEVEDDINLYNNSISLPKLSFSETIISSLVLLSSMEYANGLLAEDNNRSNIASCYNETITCATNALKYCVAMEIECNLSAFLSVIPSLCTLSNISKNIIDMYCKNIKQYLNMTLSQVSTTAIASTTLKSTTFEPTTLEKTALTSTTVEPATTLPMTTLQTTTLQTTTLPTTTLPITTLPITTLPITTLPTTTLPITTLPTTTLPAETMSTMTPSIATYEPTTIIPVTIEKDTVIIVSCVVFLFLSIVAVIFSLARRRRLTSQQRPLQPDRLLQQNREVVVEMISSM